MSTRAVPVLSGLAAAGLALAALGCATAPPAGPAERAARERHVVTGSHIPREEPAPEHGYAPAPFRTEVITRDEIRQSGANTAAEALSRH